MTVERVKIGGKTEDGEPVHLSPWTFETPQIREIVEQWLAGEVLNACAGKTKLDHDGPVHRNDIDEDRDVDTHIDVREIDEHFDRDRFDTVVYDPPYTAEMAQRHYDGNHVGRKWEARGAIANVTAPGGHVLTFGYNSDGLDGWDGWERIVTYYFRTPNWSGYDIALSVDRKGGGAPLAGEIPDLTEQTTLVAATDGGNNCSVQPGVRRFAEASMSRERARPDPAEWTVREAVDRYLRRRRSDATEGSVNGWQYRLKIFKEWCEGIGIGRVEEIRPFDMDEFYDLRAQDVAPATLEGEMWTLKGFTQFLESLGAVEDGLSDAVRIPDLDPEDRTSDEKLRTERAIGLLEHYRSSEDHYGTRKHAYLELVWFTGARQGGLRALDLRDVELDEDPYVYFRHRPDTGTPLKNKMSGERPVGLRRETSDAIKEYTRRFRYDTRDDHGRQPLLSTYQGRPSNGSIRAWSYLATLPCQRGPCPHDKDPEECEWTEYSHASKCPSSRSPHPVRTGAITWMLNRGWPDEDVAERVNAGVRTIESHYDKADPEERRRRLYERMEERRRPLVDKLKLEL